MSKRHRTDEAGGAGAAFRHRTLIVVVACVAVFVVSSWPTLTHPLVFSNDGPQHLLQGFVHTHYDDPRFGFDEVFALNEPLTSRGYLDLFRWLEPIVGWYSAHRAILLVAQALWCSGWAALALRLHRDRWPFALLGCATGIQWAYWVGVLPFYLALGAALWSLHLVVSRPARWHYGLVAGALVICCQLHVFPVVLAGSVLVVVGAARGWRDLALTILAGLPSLLFSHYVSSLSKHQDAAVIWDNTLDPVRALVAQFFCGDVVVGVVFLGLAAIALVAVWRSGDARSRAIAGVGFVFCVGGYLAPWSIRGWQLVAPRFLPFGYAFLFCAAPLERVSPRARAVIAVIVLAVVGGHASWAWRFHQSLDNDTEPVLALARQLPPQTGHAWGMLVTCGDLDGVEAAHTDDDNPTDLEAWLHLAQVLAVDLGGHPSYTQALDPSMHAILARLQKVGLSTTPAWSPTWPQLDEVVREQRITGILDMISRITPNLVFVGFSGDEALVEQAGFRITARVDDGVRTAVTATFVGCDVTVLVPPDAALVEAGAMPWTEAAVTRVPDVEGYVRFHRVSCGPHWIRTDGRPCGGSQLDPFGRARAFFTDGALLVCGGSP
jgi:hypothetical protein